MKHYSDMTSESISFYLKLWSSAIILLALCSPVCRSQCDKVLVHGNRKHTAIMGVYEYQTELYDGYSNWKLQEEDWFIYSWWGQDWELGNPVGGSDGYVLVLDQVNDYVHEESSFWTGEEIGGWGPIPEMKSECYVEDHKYMLRPGICPLDHEYNIPSISDDSYETTQEECKNRCDNDETCVTYSISRYGCKPATRPCHFPYVPEGNGFTFVSGLISDQAVGHPAYQSSTEPASEWAATADKAVDGSTDAYMLLGQSCTQTLEEAQPWWLVDMRPGYVLSGVIITNRKDCCEGRLHDITVGVSGQTDIEGELFILSHYDFTYVPTCKAIAGVISSQEDLIVMCEKQLFATAIIIYMQAGLLPNILSLCEVQAFVHEVGKYMMNTERLNYYEASAACSHFAGGKLAVADSEEKLDQIRAYIATTEVFEDFWLGQRVGSNAVNVEPVSSMPGGIPWNVASYVYLTTCSASSSVSVSQECASAHDGDDTTKWTSSGFGTGQWIKFSFRYPMEIFQIRLLQLYSKDTSFKSLDIQFSDGTSLSVTLKQRTGVDGSDTAGHYWDEINLEPSITTGYIKLNVLSTYNGGEECGFHEIQAWGGPPFGFIPKDGQCEGHTYNDVFGDFESCEDACRNDPVCVGFVIFISGPDQDLCNLLDDICASLTTNVDAVTFEKSDTAGITMRVGKACNDNAYSYTLQDATVTEMYEACNIFPDCSGFRYGDSERQFHVGHCTSPLSQDDFTFDFLATPSAGDGGYLGCFNGAGDVHMTLSSFSGSQVTPDVCITHCAAIEGKMFAGITTVTGDQSACMCGDTFGQGGKYGPVEMHCSNPCVGAELTTCGSADPLTRETSVYLASPSVTKECYIANTFNYLSLKNEAIISSTHTEYCERKAFYLCERDYDFCASSPCANGVCSANDIGFNCACIPGFTGDQCEIDVDECSSSPCIHGSCIDEINQFTCDCDPGYTDILCDTDIDECASNPCQNGGSCEQNIGDHDCLCVDGYSGHDCEIDIDECSSNPCVKGICNDQINGFSCSCYPGWEGSRCQTNIDECASGPCKNGATCLDFENRFTCACKAGYTGKYCDTEIEECISNPCQNGATCNEEENAYGCICEPGFAGVHCEINVDECESRPCENSGECKDGIDSYLCLCVPGFDGKDCNYYVGNPGVWSAWENWSACSQTCGTGVHHRSRECIPEHPQWTYGNCPGDTSQSQSCLEADCAPIDGQWGPWFGVSECSSTCGPGLFNASRLCNTPAPQYGGKICEGSTNKILICQETHCKKMNNCGSWTTWSNCTGQCGSQRQRRQRSCSTSDSNDNEVSENMLFTIGNETEINSVVDDPQERACQSASCTKVSAFSCHVCEKTFNLAGIDQSACNAAEECDSSQTMCAYTYEPLTTGTVTLKKTCAAQTQCENYWHHMDKVTECIYMRALALESFEKIFGGPSQDFQMDDIFATWGSLNESCSICCNGNACNENLFPRNNDVFHYNSADKRLQATWTLMAVFILMIYAGNLQCFN